MKKVKDDTVPRWMREDVRQKLEERRKELSIDDQMRISREANAKRKPYKDGDHQKYHVLLNSRVLLRKQRKILEQMMRK